MNEAGRIGGDVRLRQHIVPEPVIPPKEIPPIPPSDPDELPPDVDDPLPAPAPVSDPPAHPPPPLNSARP
jgi:hypothetical protein